MTIHSPSEAKLLRATASRIAPVIALCLAACSSSKDPKRSEFGPTFQERMGAMDKVIKDKDYSMRSSFEKQMPKVATEKGFKASSFNARDAPGMKKFAGADNAHRAKDFAEAGKSSRTAQKAAPETGEQSRLGSRLFPTSESRLNAKSSPAGAKSFAQGGEAFSTGENRAGTEALEKNKKPVVLDPEKPTYSEEEVKRLLNKG